MIKKIIWGKKVNLTSIFGDYELESTDLQTILQKLDEQEKQRKENILKSIKKNLKKSVKSDCYIIVLHPDFNKEEIKQAGFTIHTIVEKIPFFCSRKNRPDVAIGETYNIVKCKDIGEVNFFKLILKNEIRYIEKLGNIE